MTDPLVSHRPAPAGELLAPVAPDLVGAAVRLGHDTWWASRLFEVVGAWASDEPDGAARVLFGRHAAHLAWRAEQWHDRLPELREVPRDQAVSSPGPAAESLLGALRGAPATTPRLVGLYRVVLPRLRDAHQAHLDAPATVADGPVRRTLRFVLLDEAADLADGEGLLAARLDDPEVARAAAAQQAAFETLLATPA